MNDFIIELIKTLLFPNNITAGLVILLEAETQNLSEGEAAGSFNFPQESFSPNIKVIKLPNNENFIDEVQGILAQENPSRLFFLPPYLNSKSLSPNVKATYPGWDLQYIALTK